MLLINEMQVMNRDGAGGGRGGRSKRGGRQQQQGRYQPPPNNFEWIPVDLSKRPTTGMVH